MRESGIVDEHPGWTELHKVIAGNMRRIRRERGLLQEDIATAARWLGLNWSSITVNQIESTSRFLDVDEFLLLPLLLRCSLRDLLNEGGVGRLIEFGEGTYLKPEDVYELVAEGGPNITSEQVSMLPGLEPRLEGRIKDAITRANLEPTLLSYLLVREGARGEAERKAAQTLKIAAPTITAYALRCWGRSLTEERDARASEQATKEKEIRAVRGHVTRTLLRRIEEEHANRNKRPQERPVTLRPASKEERELRTISLESFETDPDVRRKAEKPHLEWMRFKALSALEKEGVTR